MAKKRQSLSAGLAAHIASTSSLPPTGPGAFTVPADLAGTTLNSEQQLANTIRTMGAFRVLRLKSGRIVKLTSIYIPAEDVSELTLIHEANIRGASGVNESTVDDIIGSIRAGGVTHEVLAVRQDDGRYAIFDGQRRRFCAVLAQQGLPLAYIDEGEGLSSAELRELSRIANLTMPNSLYDKGLYYTKVMSEQDLDVAGVADMLGITDTEVRYSQMAVEIPLPLYELLPSGTSTGRPTIIRLRKILKSLTQGQVASLVEWAQSKETYASAPKAVADITAQAIELAGEKRNKTARISVIGGVEVLEKKPNKFELTLPEGITRQELFDLLAMLEK